MKRKNIIKTFDSVQYACKRFVFGTFTRFYIKGVNSVMAELLLSKVVGETMKEKRK